MAVAVIVLAAMPASAYPNVILNGGFEDGLDIPGWVHSDIGVGLSNVPYRGSWSLSLSDRTEAGGFPSGSPHIVQSLTLTESVQAVTLTCWISPRIESGLGSFGMGVLSDTPGMGGSKQYTFLAGGDESWRKLTLTNIALPAGEPIFVELVFYTAFYQPSVGAVLVDDVRLDLNAGAVALPLIFSQGLYF